MVSEAFPGVTPKRINTEFTPEQLRNLLGAFESYQEKCKTANEDRGADVNDFDKIRNLMGL